MGNLNKVTYVDHQTVITADNLNAIQDSVIQNTSYTTCSTAANTAAKTAALTNFVLTTGSAVKVKFTNTNTAANPTLNINSTGAKPIMQYGTTAAGTTATESWDDGAVVEFVYDGTNWVMQGRNTIDAVSKANGGTFGGNVIVDLKNGTASSLGDSYLVAGNNTPNGTAGNSRGIVELFSEQSYYVNIYPRTLTANRALYCPDETGIIMTNQGGTFIKPIVIDEHNGTASSVGASHLTLGNSIVSGTAGNSTASLVMYGRQSYYIALYTAETLTSNRSIYFPDAAGTIALIENGSNSNGNYTKFSDGTLMQWGFKSGIMSTASNTVSATINFPVAFISTSTTSITAIPETTLAQHFRLSVSSIATSSFAIYVYSSYSTTASLTVRWTAIGRWK